MDFAKVLKELEAKGNLRTLPATGHIGRDIIIDGVRMLNMSSNDYLALACDEDFRKGFHMDDGLFSASSSRLLTGNFAIYDLVESQLAGMYGTEAALVLGSGYHMNSGILPAVTTDKDMILADKLVHASLIDGIRLSAARTVRFRHQDLEQLEKLLAANHSSYERIFVVVESVYSMDGDVTDLKRLVEMKKLWPNVMLYVDEAHAVGVRGRTGLGVAQEQGCIGEIDFLCGTLGKALASVGGYVVCSRVLREFLVNRMRTFIFTTALPPVNMLWTLYVLKSLEGMAARRENLAAISSRLRSELADMGYGSVSGSQIIPVTVGDSDKAVRLAAEFRRRGFCLMPVRPPTVPEGTSRLRISLTAAMTHTDIDTFIDIARTILPALPAIPANPARPANPANPARPANPANPACPALPSGPA